MSCLQPEVSGCDLWSENRCQKRALKPCMCKLNRGAYYFLKILFWLLSFTRLLWHWEFRDAQKTQNSGFCILPWLIWWEKEWNCGGKQYKGTPPFFFSRGSATATWPSLCDLIAGACKTHVTDMKTTPLPQVQHRCERNLSSLKANI